MSEESYIRLQDLEKEKEKVYVPVEQQAEAELQEGGEAAHATR